MLQAEIPEINKGAKRLLGAIRFEAEAGQIWGVIGPNGAGKSTLLRCLAGVGHPAAALLWHGKALPAARIGYLPQAFHISTGLSVLECVLLGRRETLGWRVAQRSLAAAGAMLDRLHLGHLAHRSMDSLSGGQQQMVLLAQRLLRAPDLMLLDEPTSALDLHHQLHILEHLRDHTRSTGSVIVMALHDLTLAARFCDRLLLLNGGTVVSRGAVEVVLTDHTIRHCWQIRPEILTASDGYPVIVPH